MLRYLKVWGLPLLLLVIGLVAGSMFGRYQSAYASAETVILKQGSSTYDLDDYSLFLFMNSSDILQIFVSMVVFSSEAETRGIKVTDAEIDKFIKDNMVNSDGENRYEQYLELFDSDTVRRQIALMLTSDKLEQQLRDQVTKENNINITEDIARKYFIEHVGDIHKPAMVEVSLLSTNTREKCEDALKQLDKGADFNELSAKMSDIQELVSQNGYLGVATYRDLESINKTLADTAFGTAEGKYSQIIRGEHNFHIVYVHKKIAEYTPTFEDVRNDLMTMLLEDQLKKPMARAYNDILERGYAVVEPQVKLLAPKNRPSGESIVEEQSDKNK
jgi:parvulin-like peptidyl-prolyl isomerase